MPGEVVTRSARMWLDDEGIVQQVSAPGSDYTLDVAKDLCAQTRSLSGGSPRPMLVDMTLLRSITRDARTFFARQTTDSGIAAVALLVDSPLSRVVGNFFMRNSPAIVPTRLFTSRDEATTWLQRFKAS
jgi:hypothetical protein